MFEIIQAMLDQVQLFCLNTFLEARFFLKSHKMFGSMMMLYASSVNVTTRYIVLVCCCSNIAALGYLSSLVERLDSVSSHIPQQKTTLSKKCSCSSRLTHASDVGLLHCKIISIFCLLARSIVLPVNNSFESKNKLPMCLLPHTEKE